MKKWLFNPFIYVAGWQALGLGLLLMAITCVIAFFSQTHFDGGIDVHFGAGFPLLVCALEQLNAWLSTVIVFSAAGFILSKSAIRIIDIAGTMALARVPMILAAVIGFVPALHQVDLNHISANFLIWSLIALLFSIWMIALMYNAFTVSCNVKGNKAVVGFIVSIILAEILSKIMIVQVYHHFLPK
ncbi:hypothetical protein [Mucilaginibacter arboris]|uniref:Yip1 domain-containing protein n=1 Tax=Mucilaginibacter arboris TaxID=2682090 RepID=A0A7K1SUB2_9SPHI|nr:hypothetical protein [Mucilaginibacter arboris]MVN20847.1 hypothetical protein [Mucilaginibacter arboris]